MVFHNCDQPTTNSLVSPDPAWIHEPQSYHWPIPQGKQWHHTSGVSMGPHSSISSDAAESLGWLSDGRPQRHWCCDRWSWPGWSDLLKYAHLMWLPHELQEEKISHKKMRWATRSSPREQLLVGRVVSWYHQSRGQPHPNYKANSARASIIHHKYKEYKFYWELNTKDKDTPQVQR